MSNLLQVCLKAITFPVVVLTLSGCSTTLVNDEIKKTEVVQTHCSGGEWIDDSSVAVLPIPVVAFFVPHADLQEHGAEQYLNRCGAPSLLKNRKVTISKTACFPAGVTRILTLGIFQWCPAHATWEADVELSTRQSEEESEPQHQSDESSHDFISSSRLQSIGVRLS